jgi:hypothetical protein
MDQQFLDELSEHLDADDDPILWQFALEMILSDLEPKPGIQVEVGRCSHWLRPHQSRWTDGGGFAMPRGYGQSHGWLRWCSLPDFDWSVMLGWDGNRWAIVKPRSVRNSLRITIPSRTSRHLQAAVDALWHVKREKRETVYGFRKRAERWVCTAVGGESIWVTEEEQAGS